MWNVPLTILAMVLTLQTADAAFLRIIEAENCQIIGGEVARNVSIWHSGQGLVQEFWGELPGQSIAFQQHTQQPVYDLRIGVRYAFDESAYLGFRGLASAGNGIFLRIDDLEPIPVTMPDTGTWDQFETAVVETGPLAPGNHVFRLESTQENSVRNIDCFFLFNGNESLIPLPLRSTVSAQSDNGRWLLVTTPDVRLTMPPSEIFLSFDRIWNSYEPWFGWTPPKPVRIHIITEHRWDNPGATAYQNQWGVFFRAEPFATEQGNWVHEMTHMFYVAHFPGWFDESSVRALTALVWMPRLYGAGREEAKGWLADGRSILADPSHSIDAPELLWATIAARYGPDVFSRFFHECRKAGEKNEIDFTPGRHLTKTEIVTLMSRAAEENVRPLFERWTGFAEVE